MYGLDGYRYQADEMMFAAPETNPSNWCYCNGECPPAGERRLSVEKVIFVRVK